MVPIDILLKSKFYSLVDYKKEYDDDTVLNISKGEIDKPNQSRFPDDIWIGKRFVGSNEIGDWIKVYLGRGYFKCISHVPYNYNKQQYIIDSKINKLFE